MTRLAVVDPPLRRLFSRLDFAPRPVQMSLSGLLAKWDALRGGAVAPQIETMDNALPVNAFTFSRANDGRDYILRRDALALEHLTGMTEAGGRLSAAPKPREAARLRRLFETVATSGEPVLAEFTVSRDGAALVADLLTAPLADAKGRIVGIVGGCELRATSGGGVHAPRPEAKPGPVLFALSRMRGLSERVARKLGLTVAPHEERRFDDGERKIRPLVGVRERDVYVFADLAASGGESVNDKLLELLFFIGALKTSAARRVTVIAPYLCYARKERQTKPRDPVSMRYLAQMFEAVGCDGVVTVAAHDLAAFQNAFRCRSEHLDLHALFARALAPRLSGKDVAVVSPDPGGEKRAELFRETLERVLSRDVGKGLVDKKRSMGKVTGELFAGEVSGRTVVIVDDMIGTGGTMIRAAHACRRNGAQEAIALAAHGLFSRGAEELLQNPLVDEIWVADGLPLPPLAADLKAGRLHVVAVAGLLGDVVQALHSGGSVNDLLEHDLSPFHDG
jgi:ribose-phosphate pyrophosphokinase